ncbi:MAG: hypothetical protein GX078_00070 [Clostridiales bacterium]|nr:hypothetical protein [Clostridiales bacterium]
MKINVIGGINVDIEGTPYGELLYQDSNPGAISINFGGVGRNVVENIARLGGAVKMISVAGDDFAGREAVNQLEKLGVDTRGIRILKNKTTAMYLSILNKDKDMEIAMCDMHIIEAIDEAFIDESLDSSDDFEILGVDCNFKEDILRYICDKASDKLLFLEPVSAAKAARAKDIIGKFDIIKPNRFEAEVLAGISISSEEDLHKAGNIFLEKGVKEIYITLNKDGVYYRTKETEGIMKPKDTKIVSATGAGDSFSGAILLGKAKGFNPEKISQFGVTVAAISMESNSAVNPELTYEEVIKREKIYD